MQMIEFTDNQKRTIANALTVLSLTVMLTFIVLIAFVVFKFLSFASSAVVPVVLGFFLALFFKPYYGWWKRVLRNPTLALIAMLVTVLFPLGLILWYAGAVFIDQISNLIAQGPELVKSVTAWFKATFPKFDSFLAITGFSSEDFAGVYSKYAATALKAGSGALKCLLGIVTVIVTAIFFVFFLMTKDRGGDEIIAHVPILKDETKAFIAKQIDSFIDILVSFFQRQIVICLIEGVMYGTGFYLVGLPYGFLIGFSLGVMNLIPFFGSVVCLPIALPIAYFVNGGSGLRVLLVLVVWGIGQFLDGYFITPKIQGDKTGLGYTGVIFSFFFWATVLGPMLGMLLAIPLSAFCVVLWRALKSKYIKPMV
jgi:predicted PurR-regulated permease PerM